VSGAPEGGACAPSAKPWRDARGLRIGHSRGTKITRGTWLSLLSTNTGPHILIPLLTLRFAAIRRFPNAPSSFLSVDRNGDPETIPFLFKDALCARPYTVCFLQSSDNPPSIQIRSRAAKPHTVVNRDFEHDHTGFSDRRTKSIASAWPSALVSGTQQVQVSRDEAERIVSVARCADHWLWRRGAGPARGFLPRLVPTDAPGSVTGSVIANLTSPREST
jgi:hypothetical protein